MPRPYFSNPKHIQSIIRVDHAGEYGAQQIYQKQIEAASDPAEKKVLQEMLDQEIEHLEYFQEQIKNGAARPSILLPVWKILGQTVGWWSQKLGYKYSMLVTEAVEEVIVDHYDQQIDYLSTHHPKSELLKKITKFQQDEAEHIHIATEHGLQNSLTDRMVRNFTKLWCKLAISLSKKL